jgi:hypothetical protein
VSLTGLALAVGTAAAIGVARRSMASGIAPPSVVPPVLGFIDDLTNWYIRLSRRRFWRGADEDPADKAAAYATLYEVLVTFAQVMAPVLPFVTEAVYQNLVVAPGVAPAGRDSVHLCDYPQVNPARIDAALAQKPRGAYRSVQRLRLPHVSGEQDTERPRHRETGGCAGANGAKCCLVGPVMDDVDLVRRHTTLDEQPLEAMRKHDNTIHATVNPIAGPCNDCQQSGASHHAGRAKRVWPQILDILHHGYPPHQTDDCSSNA